MELWQRLRHFELGWTGLFVMVGVFIAVLFLRRALPEGRRHRGRVSVLLLGAAPLVHLLATGLGILGLTGASATLHLINLALVAMAAAGVLGMIVFDLLLSRAHVPTVVRDFAQTTLLGCIVVIILKSGGIEPLGVLTTSAVATAVLGLALQGIISNVFAGLVLQMDRTFLLGDVVEWGKRVGKIVQINWRSSTILTREGDIAIVPNSTLVSSEVLNLSRRRAQSRAPFGLSAAFGGPQGSRCVTVRVGVHNRHAPGDVKRVFLAALDGAEGVLAEPAPTCTALDFEGGVAPKVIYGVRFWIDDAMNEVAIEGAVRERVWYASERAGLEGPCAAPAPADGEQHRDARLAAIARVAVLAPLDEEARRELAASMRRRRFADGERVLREGEDGDSLFVIERGKVRVERDGNRLADLGAGECFGEMSLLTGEPRAATCVAESGVECWEIERVGMRAVLERHPRVMEEISKLLAKRQPRSGEADGAPKEAEPATRERWLARLRAYFALD